jgi:hypothetical protein
MRASKNKSKEFTIQLFQNITKAMHHEEIAGNQTKTVILATLDLKLTKSIDHFCAYNL